MSETASLERKKPRDGRSFTPEFKAEIVERCRRGDCSIGNVARDFDLSETVVRVWVPGRTQRTRASLPRSSVN
jgi:transposase